MDQDRFDDVARTLAAGATRRGALRALAGGAVGSLVALLGPRAAGAACAAAGRRCGDGRRCCRGAVCKGGACACRAGLTDCGGRCTDLETDGGNCGRCGRVCTGGKTCRDGACVCVPEDREMTCREGRCGATVNNCGETVECGGCGTGKTCVDGGCRPPEQGTCPAGADSCAGGGRIGCNGRSDCVCSRTTEGETRCGKYIDGVFCGRCASSADCAQYGPGAFCAKSGSSFCCGPDAQNVCQIPCPA